MSLTDIFNTTDEVGNKLELQGGQLYLTLASDKRKRHIGEIKNHVPTGKLLYYKEEKEKDKFHKANAWSIHDKILRNVGLIMIKSEYAIYKITAEKAIEKGFYLHFKPSGYELKRYIPISEFKIDYSQGEYII